MKTTKSKDGTTIAYDVYGSGPAMILIAGAICHRKFFPIVQDAKAFAQKFTVYCYDRRGRGDSGDTLPYSTQREVEDIEAMVDAAGGSAYLYGHSSGAVLALEASLKLKTKILKCMIYDASYVATESEKKDYAGLRQSVQDLLQQKKLAEALKRFLIGIGMPKVFVYLLPLMPGWKTMKNLAPTLEYDMQLTADLPPLDRMSEIQVPTSVMYGEKSPEGLHKVAQHLARVIDGAKLICVKSQDHMVDAKVLVKDYFTESAKN